MRISEVLRKKGDAVVTVRSDASVQALVELLGERRIGAAVVSDDGGTVLGIVSERDVVWHLRKGASVLEAPVSSIMTAEVVSCRPEDEIETLAAIMTEHRFRHMPVLVDGRLRGIVSIGDIVKNRLDQLQEERDHLERYLIGQ